MAPRGFRQNKSFWLKEVKYACAITVAGLIGLSACSAPPPKEGQRRDANTPAGKLGQAAYKATVEVGRAGQVIGRKLDTAARNAHEGWKEAARKNQQNKK